MHCFIQTFVQEVFYLLSAWVPLVCFCVVPLSRSHGKAGRQICMFGVFFKIEVA